MRHVLFCLIVLVCPAAVLADDWAALENPKAVVLMRHALAPGTGDPSGFDVEDCSTQRNLDEGGRYQARRIGAALRDRGIEFGEIWTSQWCRCRDTAELLGVGEVREVPALNSFFGRRDRETVQTEETLELLETHAGGRIMLVTHQVNITALTGVFPQSGEIVIAERTPGGLTVTGQILIGP